MRSISEQACRARFRSTPYPIRVSPKSQVEICWADVKLEKSFKNIVLALHPERIWPNSLSLAHQWILRGPDDRPPEVQTSRPGSTPILRNLRTSSTRFALLPPIRHPLRSLQPASVACRHAACFAMEPHCNYLLRDRSARAIRRTLD